MALIITSPQDEARLQAGFNELPRWDGSIALCYQPTEGDCPERVDEEPLVAMLESGAACDPIVRNVDAIEAPDGVVITADKIFGNRQLWIEHIRSAAKHEMLALTLVRVKKAYAPANESDFFVAVTFVRSDCEKVFRDPADGISANIQGLLRLDGYDDSRIH